jgi:hypothetical protein
VCAWILAPTTKRRPKKGILLKEAEDRTSNKEQKEAEDRSLNKEYKCVKGRRRVES